MSSSKSAPELPPIDPDEEIIRLDGPDDVLSDKIAGEIEDSLSAEEIRESVIDPDQVGAVDSTDSQSGGEVESTKSHESQVPEDPEIDKAVDEIVAEEADDESIEDDAKSKKSSIIPASKPEGRFKKFIKSIWQDPRRRRIAIAGLSVTVLALAAVPNTRYFILNTARVRASVELRVIDGGTLQPLKNVTVKAANVESKTDSEGFVKLEGVKLGKATLKIDKRAFAVQEKTITVGWGSNRQGEFQVAAVGSQYTFYVKDAFSGLPIAKAEATSGDGNAVSNDDGKLVLVLDTAEMDDAAQINVDISADSYRTETISITANNKESQSTEMVPSRKHVFVSKRSGNYDVYTADVDGKNEKRIVGGSGYERDDISLVPHPKQNFVAYVATRENTRNQSGYLLSTLYVIDTEKGEPVKIDQSEQIQIIGWSSDNRLVYVKVAAGASGTDPDRHRLMSFNNGDYSDVKELAKSNSFNEVSMANGKIYYAPSNIFQESSPFMYVINPDGSGQQTILDKEVYAIVRSDYNTLYFSAGSDWYKHTLGSSDSPSTNPPGSQDSRVYTDNPDNKTSLWVDSRDGKGVLISYDKDSKQETTLLERGGLKQPLYWLNSKYIVFRVADGRETADYILNTDGGEARKVVDVTDTSGISRWYYF